MDNYKAIVLFDGVCNLCNASINFIIDHDPDSKFRFASLQSDEGINLLSKFNLDTYNYTTIILIEGEKYYRKSEAALRIARQLNGGWTLLYYMFFWIPTFFRDIFYDLVSKNRYSIFGRSETCRLPTPELKARFL